MTEQELREENDALRTQYKSLLDLYLKHVPEFEETEADAEWEASKAAWRGLAFGLAIGVLIGVYLF